MRGTDFLVPLLLSLKTAKWSYRNEAQAIRSQKAIFLHRLYGRHAMYEANWTNTASFAAR